ncbi:bifunctional 4-hydroxy-2-oxoglutarate aldolase/2-dehydro-3-deoxy-phosphogluconate aldolase [Streptomyces beijiangensis]|uniref:Bifunctional 4-hydroxy-2-oxoglutarate aldolase/2-dehydro-3-deoxy-phosphogluconate aldolase n=2 Tax=Streptomyces beijiangensis TaxID=163361 RepID=A0A939F1D6_9ACTN|nr:bifunctional 4-hydroxy-2-oxoglutarate aldolase/2-dehydro-3-deoxy-phosphogluconate aldolase [Streptomyces beijiangensis]
MQPTRPTAGDLALRQNLERHGLVAILRSRRPGAPLVETVRTLIEAGVRCVEITLPTPGSLEAVAELRSPLPEGCLIGVGTVTESHQVEQVVAAGGQFIVSPVYEPGLILAARGKNIGTLPGCFTATEALAAWRTGATAVKLFPAEPLGPGTVAALQGPLPEIPLVPTGGVGLSDIRPYLDAGALAVGVGSPLVGDALDGGSQAELLVRARKFVAEAAS